MIRQVLVALVATLLTMPSYAQHGHGHDTGVDRGGMAAVLPGEPGQGAFAAIAEIVALLRADPGTDWTAVDMSALRQHLIDMDDLVTHAEVETEALPDGARFRVRTLGRGGGAVARMVPAHAPVLAADTGWASHVLVEGDTVVWTVTSSRDGDVIRALGFFGLMAVGNHHQPHHLGLATGAMVH